MSKKQVEQWRGQVRMPKPIADWLKRRAEKNYQSMNAELVAILREAMREDEKSGTS